MNAKQRQQKVADYVHQELAHFQVRSIRFLEEIDNYLGSVFVYKVQTTTHRYAVFYSEVIPMNVYLWKGKEPLQSLYYTHLGFTSCLCSDAVGRNFLVDFIGTFSFFPVIGRKIAEIEPKLKPGVTALECQGLAAELRSAYVDLGLSLRQAFPEGDPVPSEETKKGDFKGNLDFFIAKKWPETASADRRQMMRQMGALAWSSASAMVHDSGVTLYDLLICFNLFKCLVSTLANALVSNDVPLGTPKCPFCGSDRLRTELDETGGQLYECRQCGHRFSVPQPKK